eukprot:366178-Chlamydomonas_euryale.AAC.11
MSPVVREPYSCTALPLPRLERYGVHHKPAQQRRLQARKQRTRPSLRDHSSRKVKPRGRTRRPARRASPRSLHAALHHIEWVDARPRQAAGGPARQQLRRGRCIRRRWRSRLEPPHHRKVRGEVHAERRRVPQHGHGDATVQSTRSFPRQHPAQHRCRALVAGRAGRRSLQLEPDLEHFHRASQQALRKARRRASYESVHKARATRAAAASRGPGWLGLLLLLPLL